MPRFSIRSVFESKWTPALPHHSRCNCSYSIFWTSGRCGSALIFVVRFVPSLRFSYWNPKNGIHWMLSDDSDHIFSWTTLLMYLQFTAGSLWSPSETVIPNSLIQMLPVCGTCVSSSYIISYTSHKNLMRFWRHDAFSSKSNFFVERASYHL
jgi:hypothetical protein